MRPRQETTVVAGEKCHDPGDVLRHSDTPQGCSRGERRLDIVRRVLIDLGIDDRGATVFAVMPTGPNSWAMYRTKATIAAWPSWKPADGAWDAFARPLTT